MHPEASGPSINSRPRLLGLPFYTVCAFVSVTHTYSLHSCLFLLPQRLLLEICSFSEKTRTRDESQPTHLKQRLRNYSAVWVCVKKVWFICKFGICSGPSCCLFFSSSLRSLRTTVCLFVEDASNRMKTFVWSQVHTVSVNITANRLPRLHRAKVQHKTLVQSWLEFFNFHYTDLFAVICKCSQKSYNCLNRELLVSSKPKVLLGKGYIYSKEDKQSRHSLGFRKMNKPLWNKGFLYFCKTKWVPLLFVFLE